MAESGKAGRLPQQFGKFGEGLVMWWLGHVHNYNVALVDHEGADIIAHNGSENLAISVKSGHRASFEFDIHNQDQLTKFAEKFGGLTPAVAFVFADNESKDKGNAMIDVFLFLLSDIKHFCDTGEKGFSRPVKIPTSCQVSNGTKFQTLQALVGKYHNREVKHIRLQQTVEWLK